MSHLIGRGRTARETYPTPPFGSTPPFAPVLQSQWFIDEQNTTGKASDSNDGATANTPLLTDTARQRRWGLYPFLNQRYDLWYLSNADTVVLHGQRTGAGVVWVHGSGVAFQGQPTLLEPPAAITAHTTINPATNTRSDITGGNAGAHISNATNPNQRLRLVSGMHTGAVAFAQKVAGVGKADVSQWTIISAFNPATFALPTEINPTDGDTYVIEQLGTIQSFYSSVVVVGGLGNETGVVIESCNLVNIGCPPGADDLVFLGCTGVRGISDALDMSISNFFNVLSCMVLGSLVLAQEMALYDCSLMPHNNIGVLPIAGAAVYLTRNTIAQGVRASDTVNGGFLYIGAFGGVGVFDSPDNGITDRIGHAFFAGPLWGSGNTAAGFATFGRSQILSTQGGSVATLTIAGANDFTLDGKTVARAWNDTTGAYTEAGGVATRATTWAHLAGSIASGGFAGNAIDVATGASIIST